MIVQNAALGEPVISGLPYCGAEFVYSAREEMVVTLQDLLTRRTRAHLQDARATSQAAEHIARLVANDLGWDEARRDLEVAKYRTLVTTEFQAAGLTSTKDVS